MSAMLTMNSARMYQAVADGDAVQETPWEGGIYALKLQFSERYPEKPPRVRFTCEIFHPK